MNDLKEKGKPMNRSNGGSLVLVTGASGFIGSALIRRLASSADYTVRGTTQASSSHLTDAVKLVPNCKLSPDQDWRDALNGTDFVVHAAARVHVLKETAKSPLSEFRKTNVEGTLHLAREAAKAGVRRFVFLSSIKVNGETSAPGRPFKASDTPAPLDDYGVSKKEAEDALRALATETGMEVVILRPPLVYGPGVKANFQTMARWVRRGIPLPLGCVQNKRSFVALDNLIDLILTCLKHPKAANQTFLVSDGEDLSTTELLRRTARALKKPDRLFCFPQTLMKGFAKLAGRGDLSRRLFGSLQADIEGTRKTLTWSPPVSVDMALGQMVKALSRDAPEKEVSHVS